MTVFKIDAHPKKRDSSRSDAKEYKTIREAIKGIKDSVPPPFPGGRSRGDDR